MLKIGIDLGKKRSDICILDASDRARYLKVATTREGLTKELGAVGAAQIAVESCRDARWVREVLRQLGHEVIVLDTSRVRALGVGQGRRKTDKRDALVLARALLLENPPQAHVLSESAARMRTVLLTRAQFVATRSSFITMLRGQMQAQGVHVPSCAAETFPKRLRALESEAVKAQHVQAVLAMLDALHAQLVVVDGEIDALAEAQECYERLTSIPGVGRIVASAFIGAIDDPYRFKSAHQVQAFLGLVPSESSTGGKRRLGSITKVGNNLARWTLVQAAHVLIRMKRCAEDPLVLWAKAVVARRGKRIGAVALARRLAGIMWALWTNGSFYEPTHVGKASARGIRRRAAQTMAEANEMERAMAPA